LSQLIQCRKKHLEKGRIIIQSTAQNAGSYIHSTAISALNAEASYISSHDKANTLLFLKSKLAELGINETPKDVFMKRYLTNSRFIKPITTNYIKNTDLSTGMGMFKDMLASGETLFRNEIALDFSFIPKNLPYRENENHRIAAAIKPIFSSRNGKNLVIHGPPGIGKTAAVKSVFRELDEETDEIIPIFVNCWQKNTTYKILIDICNQLGYKFTQNKKSDELFKVIKTMLNKNTGVVLAFDEIDKVEDYDFLYSILEEIYNKTLIMITNYKIWLQNLDERIRSRLMPELLEFRQYNMQETEGILRDRIKYAFVPGVFGVDALKLISAKTSELKDIRSGLYMLREAALSAEDQSSKMISLEHAKESITKLNEFSIKSSDSVEDDTKPILELIKEKEKLRIGDLYKSYTDKGGKMPYRTFTRRIKKLEQSKFVILEKVVGGPEGSTTIVKYNDATKKLTDF